MQEFLIEILIKVVRPTKPLLRGKGTDSGVSYEEELPFLLDVLR
jgi:hypothetical protein